MQFDLISTKFSLLMSNIKIILKLILQKCNDFILKITSYERLIKHLENNEYKWKITLTAFLHANAIEIV